MVTVNCASAEFSDLSAEILARGALLRFRAQGDSMRPFIRGGDILVIAPIEGEQARAGDAILFRQGNRLLVHRLLGRSGEGGNTLILKGDAHLRPDRPLGADQVLGRVTALERAGRTVDVERTLPRLVHRLLWGSAPFIGSRVYRCWLRVRGAIFRMARRATATDATRGC